MNHYQSIKERVKEVLNFKEDIGKWYALFVAFLVLTICVTFVTETYDVSSFSLTVIYVIELLVSCCFLIDYIGRLWINNFSIRYIMSPIAIIDLISALPLFYLNSNLQVIKLFRLLRILKLLELFRTKSPFFIQLSMARIKVIQIIFTIICIIFISSGVIYEVEHRFAPEIFANFFDAAYFTVVTLTTVGYGDIVPVTNGGRVATLLMILSGVSLLPWQFMSLARHFIGDINKEEISCKNCQYTFHDFDAVYCKLCGSTIRIKK